MKIKPTRERITDALAGGALSFHELAMRVYPPESHPKSWRYSANGGPPGCFMALSRMVRQMGLIQWETGVGAGQRFVQLPDKSRT